MTNSLYRGSHPIFEVRVAGFTVEWTDKLHLAKQALHGGQTSPRVLLEVDALGHKHVVETES